MNVNRLILSLAFGFTGLAAAHGETQVAFDNGVKIGSILESLSQMPPVVAPEPVAIVTKADKGVSANAGVKLMVEVSPDEGHETTWESPKRWPFGPYAPIDMPPGGIAALRFKFGYSDEGRNFIGHSLVFASLVRGVEVSAACGSDQQLLKLTSNGWDSLSPDTLCLPLGFERQEIMVKVKANPDGRGGIYIIFKLTVTPR